VTPRLAPVGYWQGTFAVHEDRATNGRGDEVVVTAPLAGVSGSDG
jgi:hypothetical protein